MSGLVNNVGFGEANNKSKFSEPNDEGKKMQYNKPGTSTISSMKNTTNVTGARRDTLSKDDSSVGMKTKTKPTLEENVGWGSNK